MLALPQRIPRLGARQPFTMRCLTAAKSGSRKLTLRWRGESPRNADLMTKKIQLILTLILDLPFISLIPWLHLFMVACFAISSIQLETLYLTLVNKYLNTPFLIRSSLILEQRCYKMRLKSNWSDLKKKGVDQKTIFLQT